jgi:hypothetical protein
MAARAARIEIVGGPTSRASRIHLAGLSGAFQAV